MVSSSSSDSSRRVVYAANHINGLNILRELRRQDVEVEFLVVHPLENSRCREELIEASGTPRERVITWAWKEVAEIARRLRGKQADILFSVNFGYRFPNSILDLFTLPVNLHLSLLPYNKGAFPNVWSIIEGTPAGVSLHTMTEQIDEGPILFQREVGVAEDDTAETLYRKLLIAAVDLVREHAGDVLEGRVTPREQPAGGTSHTEQDFHNLLRLEPERQYPARELINLLRAMTFPPHLNLYFEHAGGRTYLNLHLCRAEGFAPVG